MNIKSNGPDPTPDAGMESPRRTLSITRSKSTSDKEQQVKAKVPKQQPRVDKLHYQISSVVLSKYLGPRDSVSNNTTGSGGGGASADGDGSSSSSSSSSSSGSSSSGSVGSATNNTTATNSASDSRSMCLLWNGCDYYNKDKEEEMKLLLTTARATGAVKSVGDTHVASNACAESDEITLKLLQQCKNNVHAASQCFVSGSSTGCDEIFLKKNIEADSRSRRGIARRGTSSANMARPNWLPGGRLMVRGRGSGGGWGGVEEGNNTNREASRNTVGGNNQNNHNKIAKKKWSDWADTVRPLINITGRSTKPQFETLVALLHESRGLPEIVATPGTSDQHLYETMLTLQSSLVDQVQKVSSWVSQSHDLLSGSVYTRNASTGKGGTLLLEQHITRSKNLGVKVPGVSGLKHSAQVIRAWKLRVANLMQAMKNGERPTIDLVVQLLSEVPLLAYDPVETSYLKRLVEETKGLSAYITRMFPHVAWSPFVKGGMTLLLRKASSVNMGNVKVTLTDLRRYLASLNACPVHFVERDRLSEHITFAERWIVKCTHAIDTQNRNLKDLASLASEAESIPIDLSEHVSKLADAITSAQDWMNRVRKAVPRSSKTRKGKVEDHVDLATLKSLLTEGSSANHGSSSSSSSGKNSRSSHSTTTSALSNVQDIVDKAEEWLNRAKVALENRENVETTELKSFLREAEDIPVAMNEVVMLQVEIESRGWHDNMKILLQPELTVEDKMTYAGLVEILEEAEGIRSMLPDEIREQHVIKLEDQAKSIEREVKEWLSKVDTALSPNSHTPLSDLESFVAKGKTYPIDFEGRLEKLEQNIIAAKEWIVKARNMLKIIEQALKKEQDRTEARVWTHGAVTIVEEDRLLGPEIPSLKLLVATVHEIKSLGVTTEEDQSMKSHITHVQHWLEEAKQMLPKKQRKKSEYVKPSMSDFIQMCEKSRSLAVPCVDVVLSLCAEMDSSKRWLSEAAELIKSSNTAMASAMLLMNSNSLNSVPSSPMASSSTSSSSSSSSSTQSKEEVQDPQMDVVRQYYEEYVDLKKKAGASLAVSSPEERIILLRIAAAEWAESADTALTHAGSDHLPLDVAKRLKQEGQELMNKDQQLVELPSYSPENADGGGWRMLTHEKLLQRIVNAESRGDEITLLLKNNLKNDSRNQSTLEQMEGMLNTALEVQCVDSKYLNLFRQRVRKARICHENASKIYQNKDELPSIEQVQKILTQAKTLNLEIPDKKLELGYRQAASWEKRLRDSGIESGSAPVELLRELLNESKLIPIDLSAHVQVLEQATKEYCLCRAPSDGWMIGCEHCDDWFHGRCIGLKESDNQENYVCPRCVVHGFFKENVRAFRHIHRCYVATPKSESFFSLANKIVMPPDTTAVSESSSLSLASVSDNAAVPPAPVPVPAATSTSTPAKPAATATAAVTLPIPAPTEASIDAPNNSTLATSGAADAASVPSTALVLAANATPIINIDTTKSYAAPSGDPTIVDLLGRADKLLCHATDAFKTVEMFHCDEKKMEEFFSMCKFIMEVCPQCELTSRVAEWLKLQIWVSSALNILSRRPELKAVTELLNTCVHIPMPPGEGGVVLAPLRRLAQEGREWGIKIESVVRNERRDKMGLLSRKDLEETKRIVDYVINMPIVHPLEQVLRIFFMQEKDKFEQVHGNMNKKRSAKRGGGGGGSKGRRNKRAKTSSSSSSSSSSAKTAPARKKKREHAGSDKKTFKKRKVTAATKVTTGTTLTVRIIEDGVPTIYSAVVTETTNQWNHVKVQYVGFEGIFDLDLLEDEILE